MSDNLLTHVLFRNLRKDNSIADDGGSIQYGAALSTIEKLHGYLDRHVGQGVSCVAVHARNDVNHALLILALIVKKINFFLHSSNASNAGVPHFCDATLFVKTKEVRASDLADFLELQRNNAFTGHESDLKPASGAVIFTSSGTTGAPKYIYYQSDKLIQNAINCIERFKLKSADRILVPVPVNHMYGMGVGMLPAIVAGANLCLIEKNNVIKLNDKLVHFKPDITLLTPAVCRMLLLLNRKIEGGGLYISAGDRLKKETYTDFESKYGTLINLYGCTEAGAIATSAPAGAASERAEGVVSPLQGVKVRVDDGVKGEIICEHAAGFECYLNGSGERILTQETSTVSYRTRDLGLMVENGAFKVIGRIDSCVNRNGFLVSLQEVESLLENIFAEFTQVVVLEDDLEQVMGKALIAICEVKNDPPPAISDIRNICKSSMPKHWVPDEFRFVTCLPKLSNGKLDRNAVARNCLKQETIN